MLIGLGTVTDKITGETIKTFEFKGTPEEIRETYEYIWKKNYDGWYSRKKKKNAASEYLDTPMTEEENTALLLKAIDDIDINLIDLGILH